MAVIKAGRYDACAGRPISINDQEAIAYFITYRAKQSSSPFAYVEMIRASPCQSLPQTEVCIASVISRLEANAFQLQVPSPMFLPLSPHRWETCTTIAVITWSGYVRLLQLAVSPY